MYTREMLRGGGTATDGSGGGGSDDDAAVLEETVLRALHVCSVAAGADALRNVVVGEAAHRGDVERAYIQRCEELCK
jgi:hypothetical protein